MDDNKKNKPLAVPISRISRMSRLGSLAGRVAGGMISEGVKQIAKGNKPTFQEMLLSPNNAMRVADQLSQLRGAAMKVGQLMSMDAGDLLPPELTQILATLRASASSMPKHQLYQVFESALGTQWRSLFQTFDDKPIAAASIGQVHRGVLTQGNNVAIKIQYPGVKDSIDSDVDNVASLLKISRLLPKEVDIQPLLADAKAQLHAEADYQLEASHLKKYQQLLRYDDDFTLPNIYEELTTETVLTMDLMQGEAIESFHSAPQGVRDHIMTLLFRLLFKEMFEFRLIQTDPNFANYLYNRTEHQIVLLDFGATRAYSDKVIEGYRLLMTSAIHQDQAGMDKALNDIGFFQQTLNDIQRQTIIAIVQEACEPIHTQGIYDFGKTDLAIRIKDKGMALSFEQDYWHTPPADAIFLHRKLGGLYLLAAQLKARVAVNELFQPYQYSKNPSA
ncbi:ABC1 kinase family protein [Algicola sagamiensis]|uniref:ABC1 kinase family protein n=1 Tax=Algicola sagamiensis TaxID=163869 RepID=UPI0003AA2441|nr:AarF/ABC1/UbiB kinase family protein [Algicola sagamiensis]